MIEHHLRVKGLEGTSGFLPNTPFILLILFNGTLDRCPARVDASHVRHLHPFRVHTLSKHRHTHNSALTMPEFTTVAIHRVAFRLVAQWAQYLRVRHQMWQFQFPDRPQHEMLWCFVEAPGPQRVVKPQPQSLKSFDYLPAWLPTS